MDNAPYPECRCNSLPTSSPESSDAYITLLEAIDYLLNHKDINYEDSCLSLYVFPNGTTLSMVNEHYILSVSIPFLNNKLGHTVFMDFCKDCISVSNGIIFSDD